MDLVCLRKRNAVGSGKRGSGLWDAAQAPVPAPERRDGPLSLPRLPHAPPRAAPGPLPCPRPPPSAFTFSRASPPSLVNSCPTWRLDSAPSGAPGSQACRQPAAEAPLAPGRPSLAAGAGPTKPDQLTPSPRALGKQGPVCSNPCSVPGTS